MEPCITFTYVKCFPMKGKHWLCIGNIKNSNISENFYSSAISSTSNSNAKMVAKRSVINQILRKSVLIMTYIMSCEKILISSLDPTELILDLPLEKLEVDNYTGYSSDECQYCNDDEVPHRKLTKEEKEILDKELDEYMKERH